MIGGSRSASTLSTPRVERQLSEEEPDELEPELDPELDELEPDELDDPELSDVLVDEPSLDDEPLSELDEEPALVSLEVDDGGLEADCLPRLSVLKKPEPLKVTPTGWNTFFTGRRSPDPGWAYSVRESSVNACWTSMVSPVSTNL